MERPTARENVFSINELLELIILHLPLRQIPLIRAVNERFCTIVDGSIAIRRALFLHPSAPWLDGPIHYGPSLVGTRFYARKAAQVWTDNLTGDSVRPLMNPFAKVQRPELHSDHNAPSFEVPHILSHILYALYFPLDAVAPYAASSTDRAHGVNEVAAGMRADMLLTHPPVTSIAGNQDWYEEVGLWPYPDLYGAEGITLRDLVEQMPTFEEDRCELVSIGGESWLTMARSVDEVTGVEMLRLSAMRPEELLASGEVKAAEVKEG